MTEGKLPLKFDIGLSAKAEVKAEVPTSAMGRLVDSLTDAIRPFTEHRGLRGDLIRLQREDVLIEIAKRASKRLALESAMPQPVANRILIPLLEKASWTDPDDNLLIDSWANLLVSATSSPNPNQAIAVDILSKLDTLHVKLLNDNISKASDKDFGDVPLDYDEHSVRESVNNIFGKIYAKGAFDVDEMDKKISILLDVPGVFYNAGGFNAESGEAYELSGTPYVRGQEELKEALVSLNILKEYFIKNIEVPGGIIWLQYYVLTWFGVEFLEACTFSKVGEVAQ
ncbi:hypothetical protein [Rhizobium sp. FY34]|uniref:Abi-alpha family protein n=1 Tax=Rhizobium sp. FY34 TaxID=2562309 RepID=UPI0010C11BDE|nr:hypothetical protein [Rhizobium sp. FY34]